MADRLGVGFNKSQTDRAYAHYPAFALENTCPRQRSHDPVEARARHADFARKLRAATLSTMPDQGQQERNRGVDPVSLRASHF